MVAGVRDGETDLRVAYTRAFERMGEVLKNAEVSWDDVVDITSFHTDLTTQMPAIAAVKKNYIKPPGVDSGTRNLTQPHVIGSTT